MNLVIAGCSRRKRATAVPVPALELYEGGCVPQLRQRLGHLPELRRWLRILSAEHGLIDADRPLLPYDRVLTLERARELRSSAGFVLAQEFDRYGRPREALLIAEPLYQGIVLDHLTGVRLHLIGDLYDRAAVSTVLDSWGWP
ncbi:DUF6884 domain-containing protein [Spongiactinospora sp. TRM90649]|uniref:DUF6884 domain-containing protein n=1 Tax=Spongiactinospora sp. TRM90649 TaxID=3031114 RepID=UPI0023F8FFCB|nr:DUF6884 domain-containing protein [Spongiactinospora sp. TRM90649]MDF5759034.1 hypothetical protein [Spongiactinospora sp. TRM90649]